MGSQMLCTDCEAGHWATYWLWCWTLSYLLAVMLDTELLTGCDAGYWATYWLWCWTLRYLLAVMLDTVSSPTPDIWLAMLILLDRLSRLGCSNDTDGDPPSSTNIWALLWIVSTTMIIKSHDHVPCYNRLAIVALYLIQFTNSIDC